MMKFSSEKVTSSSSADMASDISTGDVSNVPGYEADLQWTPSEEKKAKLKADLFIMPFVVLLFLFLQFDRTNISNALTDTLRTDINIGNTEINRAQTMFILGFVLTELPFNMISKAMGPERFLPITMFLWGIVTWSQIFVKDARGLIAARFFVGALEGGYIPGYVVYHIFHQDLLADVSQYGLVHFQILHQPRTRASVRYLLGLKLDRWCTGWPIGYRPDVSAWSTWPCWVAMAVPDWYVFVPCKTTPDTNVKAEGILTSILAVVAYVYLPHGPAKPKTFFGRAIVDIFTPRQGSIIATRAIRNDPTKGLRYGKPVLPKHILETFSDWRLYGHIIAAFLSMIMIYPMNTYAPSIIKSLGFTGLQANGLNSVGSVGALIWSISLAYSSDRTRERGFHIFTGYLVGAAGLLWLALAPSSVGKWVLYGGVVLTQTGMGSAQAINAAWLTTKMPDYKRPVALAAYVMSIQIAGFPGQQLFQAKDAPRYKPGFITAASCVIAGAVVILVWKLLYRLFDGGDSGVEHLEERPVDKAESVV